MYKNNREKVVGRYILGVFLVLCIFYGAAQVFYMRDDLLKANQGSILNISKEVDSKGDLILFKDRKVLENLVFTKIDKIFKNENREWGKKVETSEVNFTYEAAKGKWYDGEAWNWIAWKGDDFKWRVLISLDGFDCKETEVIPAKFSSFFEDQIYMFGKDRKYCYDHSIRLK